jgi:hypothetical protein
MLSGLRGELSADDRGYLAEMVSASTGLPPATRWPAWQPSNMMRAPPPIPPGTLPCSSLSGQSPLCSSAPLAASLAATEGGALRDDRKFLTAH